MQCTKFIFYAATFPMLSHMRAHSEWSICLLLFKPYSPLFFQKFLSSYSCSLISFPFQIKSLDEAFVVGRISKHWSGFLKEILTDVDSFGIQFPLDLDVKIKAVMLGACFLIVSLFYVILILDGVSRNIWKQLGKLYS